MSTDQERDDAYHARQDNDWAEIRALTCIACNTLVPEVKGCATCTDNGHKNAGYCSECSAKCPSCGDTFCSEHAHTKTKWCDLCRQQNEEPDPSDYLIESHWPADSMRLASGVRLVEPLS